MYNNPVLPTQNYYSQGQSQMQLSPMKAMFLQAPSLENQPSNLSHAFYTSQRAVFSQKPMTTELGQMHGSKAE